MSLLYRIIGGNDVSKEGGKQSRTHCTDFPSFSGCTGHPDWGTLLHIPILLRACKTATSYTEEEEDPCFFVASKQVTIDSGLC